MIAQRDGDRKSFGHISHIGENKSLCYYRSRSIKAKSLHLYPSLYLENVTNITREMYMVYKFMAIKYKIRN